MRGKSDLHTTLPVFGYSQFDYILTFPGEIYTFICFHILIIILLFQPEELPFEFLVRQV